MQNQSATTTESNKPLQDLEAKLRSIGCTVESVLRKFDGLKPVEETSAALKTQPAEVSLAGQQWQLTTELLAPATDSAAGHVCVKTELISPEASQVTLGVEFQLDNWSTDHYLLMPAAVYAGNRFHAHSNSSSESLPDIGINPPLLITPYVPRLNPGPGPSRLAFLSGDLSYPAVAVHFPKAGQGLIIMTDAVTSAGFTSIELVENDDRTSAVLRLGTPGVRANGRVNGKLCLDRAGDFSKGDVVALNVWVDVFPAADIQAVYDRLFEQRNSVPRVVGRKDEIPFSAVWQTQENKYNEQNWVEKYGYYAVGMREVRSQDWQSGWVGGPNTLPALLAEGSELTHTRALRMIDFMVDGGITPSGFICRSFHEGLWEDNPRTLLRYSGDSLFFLLRSFEIIRARGGQVHSTWERAARAITDAFVRTWTTYGQFGNYASCGRDELRIGGTCTASMAIGALAMAGEWFGQSDYTRVAEEAGDYYMREFVGRGITNGGPGDIIQSPDSESCFGLLDSYVTLYELTGKAKWLDASRDVANQAATWVVDYDFPFPKDSTFGRLNMLTTGTVFANVQNKHSAPGLCSLSGASLLKLFRATGDERYLHLIASIAHAIPQYMSRADRPIADRRPNQRWPVMPPGWINERVNMSDWEVRGEPDNEIAVGEIFGGSTWSEVAMMLTWSDLPGVYAQPDTGLCVALDHVLAGWEAGSSPRSKLRLTNETKFDAEVKLLIETSSVARETMLREMTLAPFKRVEVPAGQTVVVDVTA